ncbi:hypothetical protein FWD07_01640 [Candidatus Saccharibacteria bacterium]|nr:hypothetical protein [Candidatus Saccharibacteria bacterium]
MSEKRNARTYARNRTNLSRRGFEKNPESDGVFLLKLVLVVLMGSFWVRFGEGMIVGEVEVWAVPVGLLLGLVLIHLLEKRRENRRTFFAVIVVVGILSFFLPAGIVL